MARGETVADRARRLGLLLTAGILLSAAHGVPAQKVRVSEELEAYPTESVDLHCQFIDGGGLTKLTQVSWIWEPMDGQRDGQRDNIAVFHPNYGESFPNPAFKGRVAFLHNNLETPSIRISGLRMSDAGRYTCEYATYPSGNEQSTTTLIMLAKPKNSVTVVTVRAGSRSVVVARCEAADGKPAASIKWLSSVGGNHSTSTSGGPDGTVTVRSDYLLVPTPTDNGREVTCMVDQRTQDRQWVNTVRLSVEYPPSVSIEGYDNNWYVGRPDAALLCLADANPPPTTVTWTAVAGPLPSSVVVDGNKLQVSKVDDAVNTTFVCEVKNKHGAERHHITTFVTEEEQLPLSSGHNLGAVLGGVLGSLLLIGIIVSIVLLVRKHRDGPQAPPKHKPRPPVTAGSSTETLSKPSQPPDAAETLPLSPGELYYEPTGELHMHRDDGTGDALNGGAPSILSNNAQLDARPDNHHDNEPDSADPREVPAAGITRGESFVSPAMYV